MAAEKLHQKKESPAELREIAGDVAKGARFTRKHAVASIYHAGSGHPGGALSCADILAVLFGAELNFWPDQVDDPHRDRFVLSKGHAAPRALCHRRASRLLRRQGRAQIAQAGQPVPGPSPCARHAVGGDKHRLARQGLSVALGMAMGLKIQRSQARVYTLIGGRRDAGR